MKHLKINGLKKIVQLRRGGGGEDLYFNAISYRRL